MNYLCEGYKAFFHHVDRPMKIMIGLVQRGFPGTKVMQILAEEDARLATAVAKAGRNEPCPCGSGLKVKKCHGRAESGKGGSSLQSRVGSQAIEQTMPVKP